MPRVIKRGHQDRFSNDHRSFLEHSFLYPTNPFNSEDDERAGWLRYRAEILDSWHLAGRRPSGYWRWELKEAQPGDLTASINRLMDLDAITEAEALLIETQNRHLSPKENQYCQSLLDLKLSQMGHSMREAWRNQSAHLCSMFRLSVRWHTWRQKQGHGDRLQLIDKYQRLIVVLEGMVN